MDAYLNVLGCVAATVCVVGLAGLFVLLGVVFWKIMKEDYR